MQLIERVGCSWLSEDRATSMARDDFASSAAWHDGHGDDLAKCDSWLCVCGGTDRRGGTWETCDVTGLLTEPVSSWLWHQRCSRCGRVYDSAGYAVRGPAEQHSVI